MKTKQQILEWLDKQSWKNEFYEAIFLHGDKEMAYDKDFLRYAFAWGNTAQGADVWLNRDREYQKWYKSSSNPPRSWEEYCRQNPAKEDDWFISGACGILKCNGKRERGTTADINIMSRELCEAFLAYMKLIQLRHAWVKDYDDVNMNYRIIASNCKIDILYCCVPKMGLSFPTQEMADEFAEIFKDLLEVAKPLL